jgi:hypothetical protein
MQQTGLKVTNLREINRLIKAVGVPKAEVKKAGIESAQVVVNEARSLVPVRSGKLRDSIRVGATASSKITIRAGGARVPYANPIHWGWYKRNIAPQPFFSKALGYTRDEIYNRYFEQLEKLITEQYNKGKIT